MTDFLTRVAQRALGLGPAIQPLVMSRYAPARLPMTQALEAEPASQLSPEVVRGNVEGRPSVRRPSLISSPPGPRLTEQNRDEPLLKDELHSSSEHAESIGPTAGNERRQTLSVTAVEAASGSANVNANIPPATKAAAAVPALSSRPTLEPQSTSLQDWTDSSAAEESSIVEEGSASVESTGEPRASLLLNNPPLQNSTAFSAGEVSSIVEEGLASVERTGEARSDVSPEAAPLQNSTRSSAAQKSSIVDEGLVRVEKAGAPRASLRQDSTSLQNTRGFSASEESSSLAGDRVNVETTGEPRASLIRDSTPEQNSTGVSVAEESSVRDGLLNVEKAGEPIRRVSRETPGVQHTTVRSTVQESSTVDEVIRTVERLEPTHGASKENIRGTTENTRDQLIASLDLYRAGREAMNTSHDSARISEASGREQRNFQVDERVRDAPVGDLRSLSAPERSRRQTDSFNEVFAQKPAASLPSLLDERVENGPPVIHVSIGRVDVRAVTPPSPAVEPPPPAAPKLSLEEFLRQPNGRRQ